MKNYNSEAEGRIDFYKELGYQGNPNEENCNVDYKTPLITPSVFVL